MEGGTERHLPKTDDHVIGSAGERRKDVEMKQKYRIIEAFEQNTVFFVCSTIVKTDKKL